MVQDIHTQEIMDNCKCIGIRLQSLEVRQAEDEADSIKLYGYYMPQTGTQGIMRYICTLLDSGCPSARIVEALALLYDDNLQTSTDKNI